MLPASLRHSGAKGKNVVAQVAAGIDFPDVRDALMLAAVGALGVS
jgi:hypothetical protein